MRLKLINFINKIQHYQKHKTMFSLNNSYYVPMYWIPQQTSFYPSILNVFPHSNFYQPYQLTVIENEHSNISMQNERVEYKQTQVENVQLVVKNDTQTKRIIKKKYIQKQHLLNDQIQDQADKLKRKLANRPKTYQTEKKMYLNQKLEQQQNEDMSRKLRERKFPKHQRSKRNKQDKDSNQARKQPEQKSFSQKLKKYNKEKNNLSYSSSQLKLQVSLNLAEVPLVNTQSQLSFEEKLQKRIDLLTRKFQN